MKIKVEHYRYNEYNELLPVNDLRIWGELRRVQPRKGVTVAYIFDDDGTQIARGIARCGKKDNYNRKIGRDIAVGRAKKQLEKAGKVYLSEMV